MAERKLRSWLGGRDDLADVQPYQTPVMEAGIRLNSNESPYPPPASLSESISRRMSHVELNRYPDRDLAEVRDALSHHIGTLSERIWAANGSNEILLQILLAFGGSDRLAMTFEPTYSMHSQITQISGTRLIRGRRAPDYSLDPQATVDAIKTQSPHIVFLCSPNNPSGGVDPSSLVDEICQNAAGIVVCDEAYVEFANSDHLALIEDHPHLIIVRSLSKSWRLAGARLGYLIAQPKLMDDLRKVTLPYHMSSWSQAAILAAVEHSDELLGTIDTIKHERERTLSELSSIKSLTAFPSQANFVFFRSNERPAGEIFTALLEEGILLRNFSDTPGCQDCLRVTIGTPEQNERFLAAIYEIVSRT